MPNKKAPTAKSDLLEAAEAIKHVTRALKKDIQFRRFPADDNDYDSVEREVDSAQACHQGALTHLQWAVAQDAPSDAEERIALQKAIRGLIEVARMLGEAL